MHIKFILKYITNKTSNDPSVLIWVRIKHVTNYLMWFKCLVSLICFHSCCMLYNFLNVKTRKSVKPVSLRPFHQETPYQIISSSSEINATATVSECRYMPLALQLIKTETPRRLPTTSQERRTEVINTRLQSEDGC